MARSPGVPAATPQYQAILFDLLTALLNSWAVWNMAARSEELGKRWRLEYLKRTYACGPYRPHEALVAEAAEATGLDRSHADRLESNWADLTPWPGVAPVLTGLARSHRLGVVTNCSERLGRIAAERVGVAFDVVVTSERAGFYKPEPTPYVMALEELDLPAERVLLSRVPRSICSGPREWGWILIGITASALRHLRMRRLH